MPKISDFISTFKTDLARPCNYTVYITPKNPITLSDILVNNLAYKCESAELPARTFGIIDQKTYGPLQRFPAQNSYDNINLTFMCSDSMTERRIFDDWMDYISKANPLAIDDAVGAALSGGVGGNFDFEYKDNYTATITINQQTVEHKSTYTIQLIEAFPISINHMPLSWQAANDYHRMTVTFSYRYYNYYPI